MYQRTQFALGSTVDEIPQKSLSQNLLAKSVD